MYLIVTNKIYHRIKQTPKVHKIELEIIGMLQQFINHLNNNLVKQHLLDELTKKTIFNRRKF